MLCGDVYPQSHGQSCSSCATGQGGGLCLWALRMLCSPCGAETKAGCDVEWGEERMCCYFLKSADQFHSNVKALKLSNYSSSFCAKYACLVRFVKLRKKKMSTL